MMDDTSPPEVTIEPADNGFVVRHYQRSSKKDESGRTIRRVASSVDDALGHARMALGGTGKAKSAKSSTKFSKRKPLRDGQLGSGPSVAEGESGSAPAPSSPAAHRARASPASAFPSSPSQSRRPEMKREPGKNCGMAEKDETPEYEARNHSTAFLRKAVRASEKKSGRRTTRKRG